MDTPTTELFDQDIVHLFSLATLYERFASVNFGSVKYFNKLESLMED